MQKSPDAFRTISEVASELDLPQHVLRFWETRFTPIKPLKRGGGRRYYRPDDVDLLKGIRQLLYGQGYTIRGVQRILKQDGLRVVQAIGRGEAAEGQLPTLGDDGLAGDGVTDRERGSEADASLPQLTGHPLADEESGLSTPDRERLRSVLDELLECERILASLKVVDGL